MTQTTGGFNSAELLEQESACELKDFDNAIAQEIGAIASKIGLERNLGIEISIRMGEWEVFKAALPGSKQESDGWINRKANVVNLTKHSTMYERVRSEEAGIDWHSQHGVGATLIDNRNNKNEITSGSLFTGPDSYSGFWIIVTGKQIGRAHV